MRVGNHPRSDGTLVRRLRQHYKGHKNGSVFRKFLGGALMRSEDPSHPCLAVATGQVVAHTKKQHRSRDFVSFLREIDERVDPTLTVHVILDNLSAHKSPLVKRWVARHPRFQFHFTPTYSAWLNLVERFFGLLTEHALKRGSHSSTHALRHAISAYVDAHNDEGKPFKWTKTADEILAKVKRFGQRTVQVHGGPR